MIIENRRLLAESILPWRPVPEARLEFVIRLKLLHDAAFVIEDLGAANNHVRLFLGTPLSKHNLTGIIRLVRRQHSAAKDRVADCLIFRLRAGLEQTAKAI